MWSIKSLCGIVLIAFAATGCSGYQIADDAPDSVSQSGATGADASGGATSGGTSASGGASGAGDEPSTGGADEGTGGVYDCVTGQQRVCQGENGCDGTQVCTDSRCWGACECDEPSTGGTGTGGASALECSPNAVYACLCGGSLTGTRICDSNGMGYGPCECDEPSTGGTGTGGATGVGGSGTGGVVILIDNDGDGYFLNPPTGQRPDCNDADASIHPYALEVCNGIDDNCVNGPDEGLVCGSGGSGTGGATGVGGSGTGGSDQGVTLTFSFELPSGYSPNDFTRVYLMGLAYWYDTSDSSWKAVSEAGETPRWSTRCDTHVGNLLSVSGTTYSCDVVLPAQGEKFVFLWYLEGNGLVYLPSNLTQQWACYLPLDVYELFGICRVGNSVIESTIPNTAAGCNLYFMY